jgi:hypothetical protein
LERSLLPDVKEPDEEDDHEHEHLPKTEERNRARRTRTTVHDSSRKYVPHGIMKTVSMSKMMKSIATM